MSGVKESGEEVGRFLQLLDTCPPGFAAYCGTPTLLYLVTLAGGGGHPRDRERRAGALPGCLRGGCGRRGRARRRAVRAARAAAGGDPRRGPVADRHARRCRDPLRRRRRDAAPARARRRRRGHPRRARRGGLAGGGGQYSASRRSAADAYSAVVAAVAAEIRDLHDVAGVRRVHEVAAADVQPDVAEAVEEDEVARGEIALRGDVRARVPECPGEVREPAAARLGVGPGDEAGAVEAATPLPLLIIWREISTDATSSGSFLVNFTTSVANAFVRCFI